MRVTIRHNIIIFCCDNKKKICSNASRGRYYVDKFCVADKRFGECPSERENGSKTAIRKLLFSTRGPVSTERGESIETLRRSLQAE